MNTTEEKIVETFNYQMSIDGGDIDKAVVNTVKVVLGEPVAEVGRKEVHGSMCCFIDRTPSHRDIPHGTKLYAA